VCRASRVHVAMCRPRRLECKIRYADRPALTRPATTARVSDVMDRAFVVLGSLSALMAVGLGAFGAHGLKGRLAPDMLTTSDARV